MIPLVPKPLTSNSKADGRFDKRDFVYIAEDDEYVCPAGQRAIKRFTTVEHGLTLHKHWTSACPRCPLQAQCTMSDYRRITRWEHQAHLRRDLRNNFDQVIHSPQSRKARQWLSQTLPTVLTWHDQADFTFPQGLGRSQTSTLASLAAMRRCCSIPLGRKQIESHNRYEAARSNSRRSCANTSGPWP